MGGGRGGTIIRNLRVLSYKTLRKVYLFNHSNSSHPSIEVHTSLFVIEKMMVIIHSLKCTVPFSFAVRLLSLAVTHCHSLSLFVTRCHSLSFVVTLCTTCCHLLSFVVNHCHSLSLDVPLVCLFINDLEFVSMTNKSWVNSQETTCENVGLKITFKWF